MTKHVITPRNHPFPFLLYLEWGLLFLAVLIELVPPFRGSVAHDPFPPITAIIVFGLMGLWLPNQKFWHKGVYTTAQVGLIMLITFVLSGRAFPFPQLIMVIRSSLIFRLRGRLIVTAIAFGLFISVVIGLINRAGNRLDTSSLDTIAADIWRLSQRMLVAFSINFSLLFGLSLLMVLLLISALVMERESREKLMHANEQLRRYALRAESLAMEQERNRIAREIHDSLGHSLTALNLQLEGALKLAAVRPEQSQEFLQEAKRLGSTALQDVRQSVAALRVNPLKDRPLSEAIATLTQDFQRTTQVQPHVEIQLHAEPSLEVATTLYRMIQEALTNIIKHAEATTVDVYLQSTATELDLTIKDNGKGFNRSASQRSGFGLQGMAERALALQGDLQIHSEPGQGCTIQVHLTL